MEISVSVSSLKHWESSSRSSCIWKWKWIAFSWLWWLKVTKKQLIKEKQQHYLPVIFNIFPGLLFFVWGLRITSLLQHCLLHLHTNLLALCLIQEPKIICGVRNDSRILVLSRRKLFPQSSCVIVSLQWLNSNKTTLFFCCFFLHENDHINYVLGFVSSYLIGVNISWTVAPASVITA